MRVRHLREHEGHAREGVCTGAGAARPVGIRDEAIQGIGQKAARLRDALRKRGRALGAEERVRIVACRQERDFHAKCARRLEGARAIHGPGGPARRGLEELLGALRRLLPGSIGVEERDDLVAIPM